MLLGQSHLEFAHSNTFTLRFSALSKIRLILKFDGLSARTNPPFAPLKEFNIPYQKEVVFSNLVNPETNAFLRYDFGILSKEGKIDYLIEYDGIQHFLTEGSGFYSKEILENIKKHDAIKTEFCLMNHIPLIRIPYTHFQELSIQDLLIESSSFRVSQATLL